MEYYIDVDNADEPRTREINKKYLMKVIVLTIIMILTIIFYFYMIDINNTVKNKINDIGLDQICTSDNTLWTGEYMQYKQTMGAIIITMFVNVSLEIVCVAMGVNFILKILNRTTDEYLLTKIGIYKLIKIIVMIMIDYLIFIYSSILTLKKCEELPEYIYNEVLLKDKIYYLFDFVILASLIIICVMKDN